MPILENSESHGFFKAALLHPALLASPRVLRTLAMQHKTCTEATQNPSSSELPNRDHEEVQHEAFLDRLDHFALPRWHAFVCPAPADPLQGFLGPGGAVSSGPAQGISRLSPQGLTPQSLW